MAASFLLSECLEKIFLNLLDENNRTNKSIKDLSSCTLVSRHWCRISTPYLYAYPFHHFSIYLSNSTYLSYFKLIRTLLSCIPKSEIERIISPNMQISRSPSPSTTFHYITYIRGLVFNEISESLLFYYRDIWLPPYISNNMTQYQLIMNHLIKYLCKYCSNLTKLDMSNNGFFYNNTIELLNYRNQNGRSRLSNLKELFYFNTSNEITLPRRNDLYLALSSNIRNLDLLYNEGINSVGNANSLSQFICSQNGLKHIILSEDVCDSIFYNIDRDYNTVFDSLSTQSESLQTLEFKYLTFIRINETAMDSLCSLKNIRMLRLFQCKGINRNLNSWAESLTNLESFEYTTSFFYPTFSEEFLIQLIQSCSNTLTRLVINYERRGRQCVQLFQQIPLLNFLTHLYLPKIYSDELISIFESCTLLIYLSTILSDDGFWEINFKTLGKTLPKDLQTIQFKGIDNYMFSSKALKQFFEDCDGKLKYLEIKGKYNFGQHYFDVANELGIQLIREL